MKKNRFVQLTTYTGGYCYLNLDTEIIKEVVDIPKDDTYSARTRITTSREIYLVIQPAKKVMQMCELI